MKKLSFTEFRSNASSLLDEVEEGETLQILKYGRSVVNVTPISNGNDDLAWKQRGLRKSLKDTSLSEAIINEREESSR